MDNQRLFTWGLFGLMFFMSWQAWQLDYHTPAPQQAPAEAAAVVPGAAPGAATTTEFSGEGVPSLSAPLAVETAPAEVSATPGKTARPTGIPVSIKTDVLDLTINTKGADIVSATTLKYPVAKDRPDDLVSLFGSDTSDYGRFKTGLILQPEQPANPDHFALYTTPIDSYQLKDGEDSMTVSFLWEGANGVSVEKQYTFTRGSYEVDLNFIVRNASEQALRAVNYVVIAKTAKLPDRSMVDVETYSFAGPVLFDGDKYEKYDIDDLQDDGSISFEAENGWIAAIQHHFLVAAIPPADQDWKYTVGIDKVERSLFKVEALGEQDAPAIASNQQVSIPMTLFVGPKLQSQLEEISPKLKLTVDYGFLTLLAQPLFWLLDKVHDLVKNWGFSIIIVTILIKLAFYRLTASSGRSMAKMRSLQPRMKKIQERYKEDRQALSREMMELYKKEKVNPAAGCLPILIQMPFFLAFYWVLLESVEMRQAPFMLWINDLSSRDPYFVLPLLMGVAMFFQQKLNPAPADPIQAKVMSVLPVIFTVFFAFFPAGLVLYWLTNTLLSIAQQWRINKMVLAEEAAKAH